MISLKVEEFCPKWLKDVTNQDGVKTIKGYTKEDVDLAVAELLEFIDEKDWGLNDKKPVTCLGKSDHRTICATCVNYHTLTHGVENLILFSGMDTQSFREKYHLRKSSDKSSKSFFSHCVDSFVIANELSNAIPNKSLVYVDDSYRPIRRRLHDTQPAKGGVRAKFSTGSFKGVRKGTMCEYGQIVGGTKEQVWYQNFELQDNGRKIYQKGKMLNKIEWLSHHYKSMAVVG